MKLNEKLINMIPKSRILQSRSWKTMVNFNLRAKNGSYHFNKTVIKKKKHREEYGTELYVAPKV